MCEITETWIKDADSVSVVGLSSVGYAYKRPSNRSGGGTWVLYRGTVEINLVDGKELSSFEY